ncbi:MAG: flavodoxin family protein [Actinobacteria bacterium]|nr:flavodoxin family protein [Actinomycetota bacterium]
MNVAAFNGSPRQKGNTSLALGMVLEELKKEGIETGLMQVGGKRINPCRVCLKCRQKKDGFCYGYEDDKDDILNECLKKMYAAQGIIIGSPVFFGSVTPEIKSLIDRAGYCSRNGSVNLLKRKVCAGVVAVRRQGAGTALEQINNLFALSEVIVAHSSYWNMAFGREIGEVMNDEEGVRTLKTLGMNMAWLLKKLYA